MLSFFAGYIFIKFNGGAFKPTSFIPLFFSITLFIGILGFNVFDFAYGMPFKLGDTLSDKEFLSASYSFSIAIMAFSAGCSLWLIGAKKNTKTQVKFYKKITPLTVIFLILMPAFFLIMSYGISDILSRVEYIPENRIGSFFFIGRVLAILMLIFLHRLTSSKFIVLLVYLLYFLIFFGAASRNMALLPICYAVSFYLYRNDRGSILKYVFLAIWSIASVTLALQIRNLDMHGIIPYFSYILAYGIELDLFILALNILTSFSYSLTAHLSSNIEYTYEYFIISIHPGTGGMVGWNELSPNLRVNKFVPYNGLSELSAMGYGITFCYFFIAGFLLKFMEVRMSKLGLIWFAFTFCICVIFCTEILQYNLRSATRNLYYAIIISVAALFYNNYLRILFPKKRKKRS